MKRNSNTNCREEAGYKNNFVEAVKKCLVLTLIFVMLISSVTGCSGEKDDESDQKAGEESSLTMKYTDDEIQNVLKSYEEELTRLFTTVEYKYALNYNLAYIDEDNMPELIYIESLLPGKGVHIVFYDDNEKKLIDSGEYGENGELAYKPGGNSLIERYITEYGEVYTLLGFEDRKAVLIQMFETDNRYPKYTINEKECDEATYNAEFEKLGYVDYSSIVYNACTNYTMPTSIYDSLVKTWTELKEGRSYYQSERDDFVHQLYGDWQVYKAFLKNADGEFEEYPVDDASINGLFYLDKDSADFGYNYNYAMYGGYYQPYRVVKQSIFAGAENEEWCIHILNEDDPMGLYYATVYNDGTQDIAIATVQRSNAFEDTEFRVYMKHVNVEDIIAEQQADREKNKQSAE